MNGTVPSLWLDSAVLEWAPEFLSGTHAERQRLLRPHEILDHAYRLIASQPTPFGLADALANLKRAVNSRLQHLEEVYRLSVLYPKAVGALERLEGVGLAKPYLIHELFDLRNDVEHKDAAPPSRERCDQLADITWYFLKTTDLACKSVVSGVTLRCESGEYDREPELWLSVHLGNETSPGIVARGWVPTPFLYERPTPGSLPLAISKHRSKSSALYSDGTAVTAEGLAGNEARGEDERYVSGNVIATDALTRRLWSLAFQSL